jgi:hypothetical protein
MPGPGGIGWFIGTTIISARTPRGRGVGGLGSSAIVLSPHSNQIGEALKASECGDAIQPLATWIDETTSNTKGIV